MVNRTLVSLVALAVGAGALVALAAFSGSADAKPRSENGRIAFGRFDPNLGDTVLYTVNPDGSDERRVLPDPIECPHWSPDGTRIATCGDPSGGSSRIIDPSDGTYRIVPNPDPANLFLPCFVWTPDGQGLACEGFGLADPSLNGIQTIRVSDGGGLTRITSNPGGDDIPGDYSPDGHRLVFARLTEDGPVGLFVVNANGTGLKQITPTGTLFSSFGSWSPQGNEIVFSQHATFDARSSIWVVHADGSGLRRVPVQPASACGGAFAEPGSNGCFGPAWSPDGTEIVFAKGTSGDSDSNLYAVHEDGTGLHQITHGGRDQSPDWGVVP